MGLIRQNINTAGFYITLWESDSTGNFYQFKHKTEPTTQQLSDLSDKQDSLAEIINEESIIQIEDTHVEIVRQLIERIKANPTVTFAQYNSYVNPLAWYDQAITKYFVYVFASKLAEKKGVVLSDATEAIAVRAVRDFIVATPTKKLYKIIFNQITD